MTSLAIVAGDPVSTPSAVPGQTATPGNKEITPTVPGNGQTMVLAITPKKKKRLRTGEFAAERIPALNLGPTKAPSAPKTTGGIQASLFNGNKEAAASTNRDSALTRVAAQIEEINSIRRARDTVIIDMATTIDNCLSKYAQGHFKAAASQVQTILTAALLSITNPPAKSTGTTKNPEKSGSKDVGAQPPNNRSDNASDNTRPTAAGPELHRGPNPASITWAQVASKGKTHKNNTKNIPSGPSGEGPAPTARNRGKDKAAKADQQPDDRIFIRVPPDHEWKKMSAIGAKQELVRKLKLNGNELTDFRAVRSGFAFRTRNQDTRAHILATGPTNTDANLKFEEARIWKTFIVRQVEKFYRDATGTHPTDALVAGEAQAAANATRPPVACRKANFGDTKDTCCYYISFDEELKDGFRLFGNSAQAETYIEKPKVIQCTRCLGFHGERNCTRTERCINCGKPAASHQSGDATNCASPSQCANCRGAHKADSMGCHARPVVKNGALSHPNKNQRARIRELGQKEFEKLNPPNKAPDKNLMAPASTPTPAPPTVPLKRIRGPNPDGTRTPRIAHPNPFVINVDQDEEAGQDERETSPARSTIEAHGDEDQNMNDAATAGEETPESPL